MYPNTQTILNSIKNLECSSESKPMIRQESSFKYDNCPFDNNQISYFKENKSPVGSARKE